MNKFKKVFLAYLDIKGYKYTETDENGLSISFNGENIENITVFIEFDKNGDNDVYFGCWPIGKFKDDLMAKGLILCNEMNRQYRWVSFCLDKDFDVQITADTYVDHDTVGEECMDMIHHMVSIVDRAYPEFMKAKFGA